MAEEAPFLSIITINKDGLRGLQRTVASVEFQTYRSYEHIIVDGVSRDGSLGYIRKLVRRGEVYHVQDEGRGIYSAMNDGLEKAKGDYVMFLNSGDRLFDSKSLANLVVAGKECDVAYGLVAIRDSAGKIETIKTCTKVEFDKSYQHRLPSLAASLISRKKLQEIGFFDTRYRISSDVETMYRISLSSGTFVHVASPVVLFDMTGISSRRPVVAWIERLIIIIRVKPSYVVSFMFVAVGEIVRRAKVMGSGYIR